MNATFYARTSTSNRENRAEHRLLEHLKERLGPEALENGQMPTWSALRQASLAMSVECDAEDQSQIERLTKIIENKANQYLNKPNKKPLDIKRCELLAQCLAYGQNTSYGTGLYTLTAPTGSGKTISSIAFALKHAHTNNLQRIIYVIPYTSIIDQTVSQFEEIFGTDAVLPHYSEAPYQLKDESDMDETDLKRVLAAENWNTPIVVTTAVQFFESLYSNKTSRCRKLHNDNESTLVSSLVSGKQVVPENIHPKIKGVAGAQSAGASLISFNAPAFCSHGAEQNENAPMSKREAYEYPYTRTIP